MAKRQRMKAADRRAQILAHAATMLADKGDFTTLALANACTITEPIIYRHFPNGKSELIIELLGGINSTDSSREMQVLGAALSDKNEDIRRMALRVARSLRKATNDFDRRLVDALVPDRRGGRRKPKPKPEAKPDGPTDLGKAKKKED